MTAFWFGSAGAIIAAALVVILAPARWRGRAMLAWLAAPIPLYFAVVVFEVVTRPAQENAVQNTLLGFSLISAFLIMPWLLVCGLGFGLGLVLRRRLRGPDPVARAVEARSPDTFTPPQPAPVERDGWRSVHLGFSNDGLTIGGHDVWTTPWRDVGAGPLPLPHPAHPAQMHAFTIYELGDREPVRLAVAELSNGVWGFYAPVAGASVVHAPPAPSQGDTERRDSPFGDLCVEFAVQEWSNGHFVYAPRVVEIDRGQVLFDLHGTDWDATAAFPAAGQVTLGLRRYRGGATAQAAIDFRAMRYELTPGSGGDPFAGPLSELRGALARLS